MTAEGLGIVRVLRVIRILRLSRYSESFDTIIAVFGRTKGEIAVVGLIVAMAVSVSSVLMFQLEHDAVPSRSLKFSDAVWWSCATITTVGYGDVAPVTYGGRVVGVLTMLVGVCSYGVLLTLFGGAWIDVLKERRASETKQWHADDADSTRIPADQKTGIKTGLQALSYPVFLSRLLIRVYPRWIRVIRVPSLAYHTREMTHFRYADSRQVTLTGWSADGPRRSSICKSRLESIATCAIRSSSISGEISPVQQHDAGTPSSSNSFIACSCSLW